MMIKVKYLRKMLSIVGPCKGSRIPVLGFLRVEVGENGLTISGTDLETWRSACYGEPGGDVLTVPDAALRQALKGADGKAEVTITADGRTLRLDGIGTVEIPGGDPAEFPADPGEPASWYIGTGLAAQLSRVAPSVTRDETRFAVAGALLALGDVTDPFLTGGSGAVVGTDGHRLTMLRLPAEIGGSFDGPALTGRWLLPKLAIDRLIPGADGEAIGVICGRTIETCARDASGRCACATSPGGGKTCFAWRGVVGPITVRIVTRTLEGTFPQYHKVIPLAHPLTCELDGGQIKGILRQLPGLPSTRMPRSAAHAYGSPKGAPRTLRTPAPTLPLAWRRVARRTPGWGSGGAPERCTCAT